MDEEQETPAMPEDGLESPPPPSLEEGYIITLTVTPTGFTVSEPQPMSPEPQAPTDEEEPASDLTSAIKTILAIVKEHPVGGDAQKAFEQAYKG